METSQDHNKIIRQAAREVLEPLGLFQRGQSRLWIDDNGWFLTLVDFSPSSWSKGSYLDTAVHFLWGHDLSMTACSYDFPGGARQGFFEEFTGDDADFHVKMISMARQAAQLVTEYRKLQDISYGKEAILKNKRKNLHACYHRMMICGLAKDPLAEQYHHSLILELEDYLQHSPDTSWVSRMLDFTNSLDSVVHDPDLLQARIVELINERRNYLHTKPSYKKLDPAPYAPPSLLPPPYSPPGPKKVPWWRFWDHNS